MLADVDALRRRIEALPRPDVAIPWFLDIDGVVNIIGNRPRDGWPRYANVVIPQGVEGLAWPVCYAPALIELMNLLHERQIVSFRWLTTWEYDAPKVFAPAVGLNLGAWVAAEDLGTSGTWWKLDAIIMHLADAEGSFIWTDDDINHFLSARRVVDMLSPERGLVICPDERKGLTPEQFEQILAVIEKASR